jgi:hypothetical protein
VTSRSVGMAVSALALLAGTGIVIIAVAFLGGGEAKSEKPAVVASPSAALASATVTPTPEPRTPKPPIPTTIGAGPKPTLAPTVFAPSATPTPEPEPTKAEGSAAGPAPSASPPPTLPDLVVLDLAVLGDRVSAVIGNVGQQAVPAGTAVELAVDGGLSGSSTLTQSLGAGGSISLLLAQEFVYGPESVTARVDPRNLITEANEGNNSLTRQLEPDIPLDLAVTGLAAVGGDEHLSVTVQNNSSVPARQVAARLSVYRSDSSSPLSVTMHQLSIEPQGATTLAPGLFAVRGLSLRVVLELVGTSDGNPSNNVLESIIP